MNRSGNTFQEETERGELFMPKKKEGPIEPDKLEPEERMKYEIAEELGLLDRVLSDGWKSLTARETGRVGGILAGRKRAGHSSGKEQ